MMVAKFPKMRARVLRSLIFPSALRMVVHWDGEDGPFTAADECASVEAATFRCDEGLFATARGHGNDTCRGEVFV